LSSILIEKYKNEFNIEDLNKNINDKDKDEIKLKIKNEAFNADEELETQIKDKIQQIEEEIISLKGKGG